MSSHILTHLRAIRDGQPFDAEAIPPWAVAPGKCTWCLTDAGHAYLSSLEETERLQAAERSRTTSLRVLLGGAATDEDLMFWAQSWESGAAAQTPDEVATASFDVLLVTLCRRWWAARDTAESERAEREEAERLHAVDEGTLANVHAELAAVFPLPEGRQPRPTTDDLALLLVEELQALRAACVVDDGVDLGEVLRLAEVRQQVTQPDWSDLAEVVDAEVEASNRLARLAPQLARTLAGERLAHAQEREQLSAKARRAHDAALLLNAEVCQALAPVLGFPRAPGEAGSPDPRAPYVVDPHTAESLAMVAADRIRSLQADAERLRGARDGAWGLLHSLLKHFNAHLGLPFDSRGGQELLRRMGMPRVGDFVEVGPSLLLGLRPEQRLGWLVASEPHRGVYTWCALDGVERTAHDVALRAYPVGDVSASILKDTDKVFQPHLTPTAPVAAEAQPNDGGTYR